MPLSARIYRGSRDGKKKPNTRAKTDKKQSKKQPKNKTS